MSLPRRQQRRGPSAPMPGPSAARPRSESPQMPMPTPNQPQWPAGVTPPPAEYSDVNQIIQSDQQTPPRSTHQQDSQPNPHHGRPRVHRYDSSQYIHNNRNTNSGHDGRGAQRSGASPMPTPGNGRGNGRSAGRSRQQSHQINESGMLSQLNESGPSLRHPTNNPTMSQSVEQHVDPRYRTRTSNDGDHNARDEYGRPIYNRYGYKIQWYPGYPGTDYPKGLGHGPVVQRRDIKRNKMINYEGMSWEKLPESLKRQADAEPYDDAGALRIFYRGDAGMIYEYGSEDHARKMETDMQSKLESFLNEKGCIQGYKERKQKDANAAYLIDTRNEDGKGNARPDPTQYDPR